MKSRASESGMTLAEILVAVAAGTIVLVSALTMLDYGRRAANAQDDVLAVGELSRTTTNYISSLVRQAETGTTSSNPLDCTTCHVDSDGALINNPATNCPLDMTIPTPPIRIQVFNVDPNSPATRTVQEPGNGIWFDADRATAPTGLSGTTYQAERRSLYPQVDPNDPYLLLEEQEDYNRDGTPEFTGPVIYGLSGISFRLLRATAPAWAVGTSVTPSCSTNPANCHGTGNTNLGGRNIYGNGTWTSTGSPGRVWAYNHPDSQAIRGVDLSVTAASRGQTGGGQPSTFTRTLHVLATPRRLQQ